MSEENRKDGKAPTVYKPKRAFLGQKESLDSGRSLSANLAEDFHRHVAPFWLRGPPLAPTGTQPSAALALSPCCFLMSGTVNVFVVSPDTHSERRINPHITVEQLKVSLC